MKKIVALIAICVGMFAATIVPAAATLLDRGNGFIYDDVQNITWVQDANLCVTLNNCINDDGNGGMVWDDAVSWAANLNFLGFDDWRLPNTVQPDPSCTGQASFPGFPDQGYASGCTASEMGHLLNVDGITIVSPGLFANVQNGYWSGTEFAPNSTLAWEMTFAVINGGDQNFFQKTSIVHAWAVRDGDVFPVPEPTTLAIFGIGLVGLVGFRRKRK